MRSTGVQGALKLPIHQSKQRQKKERGSCDPLSDVKCLPVVITSHDFVVDSLNIFHEPDSVVHLQHDEVEHLLGISSGEVRGHSRNEVLVVLPCLSRRLR